MVGVHSTRALAAGAFGAFALIVLVSTVRGVALGDSPDNLFWLLAALAAGVLGAGTDSAVGRRHFVLFLLLAVVVADGLAQVGLLPFGVRSVAHPGAAPSLFFDTNERAVVLALFPPVLLGLGRPTGAASPIVSGFLMLAVFTTGSRGGLLVLALGIAGALVLPWWAERRHHVRHRGPRRGREASAGFKLAVAGIGTGTVLLALVACVPSVLTPSVVTARLRGEALGLGGRVEIWRTAARAASELPLFGDGAGAYRRLVPDVIPYPPWTSLRPVDDAHSLALDLLLAAGAPALATAALGVGLLCVGLIAILVSCGSTDEASLDGRRGEAAAWLAAGGALGAWSLVDSLPPGSPGFVVLCALVGCGVSCLASVREDNRRELARPLLAGILVGAVALALLAATPQGRDERAHRLDLRADPEQAARATISAIDSGTRDLGRLAARRPHDAALARRATERWPTAADAWRWHALAARSSDEPADERRALWRVVALDPGDARSRLALGDTLAASSSHDAALDAYSVACENGDPGANACLRGGRLAEALGQPQRAASLYHRSRWPPVRARAAPLRKLCSGPT